MMEARMRGSILPPHSTSPTLLAAKALRLRQHRGEAGGARALRHGLLQREIGVDRALDVLLVDQHDVAHQCAHDRQRQRADILDRDAFGERRAAERPVAAVRARSTSTDRARPRRRRSRSPACSALAAIAMPEISPPPPIGITSMSRSGIVFQHLERDRALAGDDVRVVVGMDPDRDRARCAIALGARLRLRDGFAVEHDLGAMSLASPRPSRTASSPASRWSPECRAARA